MGNTVSQVTSPLTSVVEKVNPLPGISKLPVIGTLTSNSSVGGSGGSSSGTIPNPVATITGTKPTGVPIVDNVAKPLDPLIPITSGVANPVSGMLQLADISGLLSAQTKDFTSQIDALKTQVAGSSSGSSSILSGVSGVSKDLAGLSKDLNTGFSGLQKGVTGDLTSVIRSTGADVTGSLKSVVDAQTTVITSGLDSVNKGLDSGFNMVNAQIDRVDNKIDMFQQQQLMALSGFSSALNTSILGVNQGIQGVSTSLNSSIQGVNQNLLQSQNNLTQLILGTQMNALALSDRTLTSIDSGFQNSLLATQQAIGGVGNTVSNLADDVAGLQTTLLIGGALGLGALFLMQSGGLGGSGGTVIVR